MIAESLDTFFDRPPADLNTCDQEPIHVPGAVQGHGALLVVDPHTQHVRQASANTGTLLGVEASSLIGQRLADAVGEEAAVALVRLFADEGDDARLRTTRIDGAGADGLRSYYAAGHRNEAGWIVELEPVVGEPIEATRLMADVDAAFQRLRSARSIEAWCDVAAREVQRLSGYDRVMVYRFDADWHGQVVAEARSTAVDSFLGLYFPAGDIPRQARRLYVLNPLRFIADVAYAPVPLQPALSPVTGKPLDLSYSLLRSVSPVHIEYLHNMDVGSSMSISIVQDGELWGLIACHHTGALALPQPVRAACGLLGQTLSLQLPLLQERERAVHEVGMQAINLRLFENMTAADSVAEGLTAFSPTLLDLISAEGAAVVHHGACTLMGQTPSEQAVRDLAERLSGWVEDEPFVTDRLPSLVDEPEAVQATASGLLAIPIGTTGQGWVMWFREEKVRSVLWAGDRTLAEDSVEGVRISPRKSFEQWREVVRGTARPWQPGEVAAAETLQRTIIDVVLRKAEELARLNQELATANRALQLSNRELQEFATVVAHDLKEPLRKISTFANLIGAELADSVSEEGRYFLKRMQKSAVRLLTLVNDLLALAQVANRSTHMGVVDLDEIVEQVREELDTIITDRRARLHAEPLPTIPGDRAQLTQLVYHLVDNAIKFQQSGQAPDVRITGEIVEGGVAGEDGLIPGPVFCLTVADNGIGFEAQFAERVFKPFQRLHGADAYEGTGIGLALCRRIVERHGGAIRVESELGRGSRFIVCLPMSGA